MKASWKKITAISLCAVLGVSGAAFAATALRENREQETGDTVSDAGTGTDAEEGDSTLSNSKDETVYVLAEADGSVKKVIVSDWISNLLGSDTVSDRTELTDAETVKGEESSAQGAGGARVWDAQGHDIYYQGSIEKELPVQMKVTYKLDGREISPEELAGKSGRVTIRFDYDNQQYETVQTDGKEEKIYVPFAMATGILLDNDVCEHVQVTNGRILNDGSRTAVMGIAFPGLQEDLDIPEDKFEIPDYLEITCDARHFELPMTVTLAENPRFDDADVDHLDSAGDLSASMDELSDAMGQLMGGSSQLYDGLAQLLDKSGQLASGVDTLAAGATSLKAGTQSVKDGTQSLAAGAGTLASGAASLAAGAGDLQTGVGGLQTGAGDLQTGAGDLQAGAGTLQAGAEDLDSGMADLQTGAAQLLEGLNALAANNDTLNGGAKQIFETLLSTADSQLASAGLEAPSLTMDNYGEVLTGVIDSLDEKAVYEKALAAITAAVEAKRGDITEQVTAAVREQVVSMVTEEVKSQVTQQVTAAVRETVAAQVILSATKMEKADYDAAVAAGMVEEAVQKAVQAAIDQQMDSEQVLQTIEEKIREQMDTKEMQAVIEENVSGQMDSGAVKKTIADNTQQQVEKAIADNMASDQVQAQFAAASEGARSVITLKTSLDSYRTFYTGLQTYTAGVSQAAAGAGDLKAGTDQLKAGTGQLKTGAGDLKAGTDQLKAGTDQLKAGADRLKGGADQLKAGADQLKDGTATLDAGAGELKDGTAALDAGAGDLAGGIGTLKGNTPTLVDGVTRLKDGSGDLSSGLGEFDQKAVRKLTDVVKEDLEGFAERLKVTRDVSRDYRTFAGTGDGMDGKVRFIYRTDPIEEKE